MTTTSLYWILHYGTINQTKVWESQVNAVCVFFSDLHVSVSRFLIVFLLYQLYDQGYLI